MILSIHILLSLSVFCHGRQLKFVQAIWRHGHRAPMDLPYPLDPYTIDYWPRGWAQLTTLGMRQMRQLGQFFRSRYSRFLSKDFNREELYVQSSDVDRALVSAQSFLYGLYPTSTNNSIADKIDWQPIAVHSSSPGAIDLLCYTPSLKCPNVEKFQLKQQMDAAINYTTKYAELLSFLSNATGIPKFGAAEVSFLHNQVYEVDYGYTALQPSWFNTTWIQYGNRTTSQILNDVGNEMFVMQYGDATVSQYYTGYTVNYWIETALAVANGTQISPSKMRLFSSHDTVLMSFMTTLGMGTKELPPVASALIWEIYEENDGEFTIEFYFHTDINQQPLRMYSSSCGDPCYVSNLTDAYAKVVRTSIEEAQVACGEVKTPTCFSCNFLLWASIVICIATSVFQHV